MIRAEYGCSAAVLLAVAAIPLPVDSLYIVFNGNQFTRSEKAGVLFFDVAKTALFVWGVIDALSNGATNLGRIAVPYTAVALSAMFPVVRAVWNDTDYIK